MRLILFIAIAVLFACASVRAQSLEAKEQAREIVDYMEHVADAYRRMGLDAPSWRDLQRYQDNLEELLDRDNQKALICTFTSYTAFVAATLKGRMPDAASDEDFPPGSLIDWLLHYSEPLVARVAAGSLEFEAAKGEVNDECMRHRFVFVLLNDIPMHEIDVPAEEECLRGGPCPRLDDEDDWGDEDDWSDEESD